MRKCHLALSAVPFSSASRFPVKFSRGTPSKIYLFDNVTLKLQDGAATLDLTYVSPSLAVRFLTDFAHLELAYPRLVLKNFAFLFNTEYAALFKRLLSSMSLQGSISYSCPVEAVPRSNYSLSPTKARRSQIPAVYWKDIGGHEEAKAKLRESFDCSPKVAQHIEISRP